MVNRGRLREERKKENIYTRKQKRLKHMYGAGKREGIRETRKMIKGR